jgi:hypothetical protein
MNRRDFIRTTGVSLGVGALGLGAAASAPDDEPDYDTYQYHGTGAAPGVEELVVHGSWAFCATNGAITTVDLREPSLPQPAARVRGDHEGDSADVKVDDYVTESGERRRIAILTHNADSPGISVFDVTDPAAPTFLTFVPTASAIHNAFLKDGFAYLTVTDSFDHSRLSIYDLRDPENPTTLEGVGDYADGTEVPDEERGTGGSWMLRDAREDMANAGVNPLHDIWVADHGDGELAYLCYWEAGVVVVDVSGDPYTERTGSPVHAATKTNPVAVAHFGAVDYADEQNSDPVADNVRYVNGGAKSNAHYVQPTPDGDYTFVGAETFGGTGHETHGATGDHGGIRAFDTRSVDLLSGDGVAIYPEADGVTRLPTPKKNRMDRGVPIQRPTDERHPENPVDFVAYIEAPDQPDDAALTSHNFDVTETKLFTSWYQGGIRAFDLGPLYAGDDYETHPTSASDVAAPTALAAFAPDGMAFWTAENLAAEQGETYYTVGSDIGKGAVVIELTEGLQPLP